ncbi:CAP domain-containing protein [Roseateles sp. SL47]|uniref:CAP domain-containing protein n=1 Tax=Roseateles sp. SL47 TaxID=2995138 RepID=UPI00226FB0A8|nr:CAP domain-containing protein [Roseateles sp. SL47]WAC72313.1 CAP domain-containing protein [Roseateles sp. SL47]
MDTFLTHTPALRAPHTRPRKATWPAVLITLVLTACGGGGSDSSSSDGNTGTTPQAEGNCGLAAQAAFQQDLLDRINAARAAGANCGSSGVFAATTSVSWNSLLTQAANNHALDMTSKNFFSHTGSNGSSLGDRVTAVGYPWSALGENIAAGQPTVKDVMDAWMDSPGHCANIMSPSFTEVGVSCQLAASTSNPYSTYWVMDLGARR